MREKKRSLLPLILGILAILVLGCAGGFVWMIRGLDQRETVTDAARYSELHARFPSRVRAVVPGTVPAGATVVSFEYQLIAGLGPSLQHFSCRIRMPVDQAVKFFEERRAFIGAIQGDEYKRTEGDELELSGGDRIARISLNRETGEIELHMSDN